MIMGIFGFFKNKNSDKKNTSLKEEEEKIEDESNRKEIMMIAKYYLTDPDEKSNTKSFLFPEDKNLN